MKKQINKNNETTHMSKIPSMKTFDQDSCRSSISYETSKSIRDQIKMITRESRDYSIVHQSSTENKCNEIRDGFGIISSLNTSISKKLDSIERPISVTALNELDLNKELIALPSNYDFDTDPYVDTKSELDIAESLKTTKNTIESSEVENI